MLWPTACSFSANCLIGLSLMTRIGALEPAPEWLEPHPARGRFLGSAEQPLVGAVEVPGEQVPAVVQDQVRLRRQHLVEVTGVYLAVPGRAADNGDALRPQGLDRVGLGGIEVPGRDKPRSSVAQRQQERHGLGLEMNAGADGQAVERARLPELRRDRPQQLAVLPNPIDPCGNHLVSHPFTRGREARLPGTGLKVRLGQPVPHPGHIIGSAEPLWVGRSVINRQHPLRSARPAGSRYGDIAPYPF